MSRRSCGDHLNLHSEAVSQRAKNTARDEAFERAACLARGESLSTTTRQIRAGRLIRASLGEHDLMHEHVQPSVAEPVEPVTRPSGTGGLQRRDTGTRGEVFFTEP